MLVQFCDTLGPTRTRYPCSFLTALSEVLLALLKLFLNCLAAAQIANVCEPMMSGSNPEKTPRPNQKSPLATKSSQKPGSVQKQQSLLSFFTRAAESPVHTNKKGGSDPLHLSGGPIGPPSPANQQDTKHSGRRGLLCQFSIFSDLLTGPASCQPFSKSHLLARLLE